MAVISSKDRKRKKSDIKSFFTGILYSVNIGTKFDKKFPVFPTYIFNTKITSNNLYELDKILKTFLYMSYRKGFVNLKEVGCHSHTSDSGWGCMLRCSQMILSKALIEKKLLDLKQNINININDDYVLTKIRKDVLSLFIDHYLSIEEVQKYPDYLKFLELLEKLDNIEYKSVQKVIPPYSIHILCKLGNCSGEYTSDMNMINVISEINSIIFNDINIIGFCVGTIKTKTLFKEFCEEYNGSNNINNSDLITYNGVDYIFKKGGVIFISFRLGLECITPEYYAVIPLLFSKFRNNLGIIGGIKKRAYYFIGIQGDDKLIFADPHLTQEIKDNLDEYYKTCYADNIYLLDIKEMRCQFSLAIGVFNTKQFNEFLEDAKWFNETFKDFIKFDNK